MPNLSRPMTPLSRSFAVSNFLASLGVCATLLGLLAIPAHADKVRLLVTDQTRLEAHFDVVDNAVETLDVSFAFFHDDYVSRAFLNKLVEAANRKVKVRLLLDGLNNDLPRDMVAYLIHNGVQVKLYHYLSLHPRTWSAKVSWLWKRMHDKQVVADGWRLIAGTENMSWLSGPQPAYRRHIGELFQRLLRCGMEQRRRHRAPLLTQAHPRKVAEAGAAARCSPVEDRELSTAGRRRARARPRP
ncbi:MAG: hypothetical protein HY074_01105 [Deltaproteobacteria bacterium]|nr:hypothetical protein [Deltaproteobacteria bacterium]